MDPGFSEAGTWKAGGASWETDGALGTTELESGGVDEGTGVASVVEGTLEGGGGVASAGATLVEERSWVGAVITEGSAGVDGLDVESTAGSGATG